jgi:hypothetical protein
MAQSVTSITGDGTIISNSGSTGAVTLTRESATAESVLGNTTGSSASPSYTTAPVVSGLSTAAYFNASTTGTGYELGGDSVLYFPDGDTTSIAVGDGALGEQSSTSLYNTGLGVSALFHDTSGSNNVAVGFNALAENTTGNVNIAVGQGALFWNTTGNYDTAIGEGALN